VDPRRFAPSPLNRKNIRRDFELGDAPVVFSAGRLVRKKGFEYLIRAAPLIARDHPKVRVSIPGDGDLRGELSALAASAGTMVTLIGAQSQNDVARWVAAADVVAIPSIHDDAGNVDGLPNFALESLSSAAPVVATTAGGLPQTIEDGVSGRLVAERNVEQLAQAISAVLSNPSAAQAMGDAARRRMIDTFSWRRT